MEYALTLKAELRVWQDERLGQLWRVAYRDGDDEMVVSFPDAEALGDFIAERFGLDLLEAHEVTALAA
ncbi:MAG: hypothetical protein HGA45_06520 [Chloroflexales bacterium]|nr:hypothetical protein [Chloroflexales bacterium]